MELRDYQSAAIEGTYQWFRDGKGNPLIVAPTGAGKSVILSEFMRRAVSDYPDTRIICATHVKELIAQNFQALLRLWPNAPAGIYSAGLGRRQTGRQITFAGIQSVARRAADFGFIDILIVDECFPAGTLIKTPGGSVEIQDINVGQIVENACGYGVVEATKVSSATKIVRIETGDGSIIECTENHPIFTEIGWVKAGKLEVGRRLFSREDVRALRRGVSPVDQEGRERGSSFFDEAGSLEKAKVLLNILLEEGGKRHARSGGEGKAFGNPEINRTQAAGSVGERSRDDEAASCSAAMAGEWLDRRIYGSDRSSAGRGNADCVQDRHCPSRHDDRDRSGRAISLRKANSRGSTEGRFSGGKRVVSVSHQERSGAVPVYNLQVSGHPSYFAGGSLVHNCHLIPRSGGTQYQRFIADLQERNPAMKVVGLTATPFRLDSGRLDAGDGAIFDGIAYNIPIPLLVDRGYLSPLVSKRPGTVMDVSGLHTRGGEFIESEMDARFNTDAVTKAAVSEVIALGQDRRSWLLFCISVDHAMAVRDELRSRGITAECVTGSTDTATRARILTDFKAGRIRAVTNVNVLTTGFDAPATDLLAFLRPTKSLGLYMQMAGRAMRTAPGKVDGLVLDFAGNVARHGPVDAVNVSDVAGGKKGDGEPGQAPAKECPECQSILWIGARECPDCGHVFPEPEPKIERTASTEAIMNMTAQDDWRAVTDFNVALHRKPGADVPTMRVEYLVDGNVIREWVCFQHVGFPRQQAVRWWHQNAGTTPPETVAEALSRRGEILPPGEVVLRREGKYSRVVRARGAMGSVAA